MYLKGRNFCEKKFLRIYPEFEFDILIIAYFVNFFSAQYFKFFASENFFCEN